MEVIQLTAIYSADTDDESHEVQEEEEEVRVVRWTSGQDTVEESSENSGAVQETTENIVDLVENMANGVLPDKAVVRSEEVSGSSRDGCEGQTSDHRQEIKIAYFKFFLGRGEKLVLSRMFVLSVLDWGFLGWIRIKSNLFHGPQLGRKLD